MIKKITAIITSFVLMFYAVCSIRVSAVPALPIIPVIEGGIEFLYGLFANSSGITTPKIDNNSVKNNLGDEYVQAVGNGELFFQSVKAGNLNIALSIGAMALAEKAKGTCAVFASEIDSIASNASSTVKQVSDSTFTWAKGLTDTAIDFYSGGDAKRAEALRMAKQAENAQMASFYLSLVNLSDLSEINYASDISKQAMFNDYCKTLLFQQGTVIKQTIANNITADFLKLFNCASADEFFSWFESALQSGNITLTNAQIKAINDILYMNLNGYKITCDSGKIITSSQLLNTKFLMSTMYFTPISYLQNNASVIPFSYCFSLYGVVPKIEVIELTSNDVVYSKLLTDGYSVSSWNFWYLLAYGVNPVTPSYRQEMTGYKLMSNGFIRIENNIYKNNIFELASIQDFTFNIPQFNTWVNSPTTMISTTLPKTLNVPKTDYGTFDVAPQTPVITGELDKPVSIPIPKVIPSDIPQTIAQSIPQAIPQAIPTDVPLPYIPDLPDFDVPALITTKFPFCLPFDFIRGIRVLVVEPQPPIMEYNVGTEFQGHFIGGKVKLDFTILNPLVRLLRWLETIGFCYVLMLVTKKLMKG